MTARWLLITAGLAVIAMSVLVPVGGPRTPVGAATGDIAVVAPFTGTRASMAAYPDGTPHAHTDPDPLDILSGSTTPTVYGQLDYLPSAVTGGYLQAYLWMTGCGAYSTGNAYYNGRRVEFKIFFHNTSGEVINLTTTQYLHIAPGAIVGVSEGVTPYRTWNNPYATYPAWTNPQHTLNNGTGGGANLGEVYAAANSSSCWVGNHVHMETDPNFGYYRTGLGSISSLTGRITDVYYMDVTGITGELP